MVVSGVSLVRIAHVMTSMHQENQSCCTSALTSIGQGVVREGHPSLAVSRIAAEGDSRRARHLILKG